mmetsp:Transcript_972/g.4121  ORF Transcript_972/g.4121 Transcript_972/m.4121 type:complete len:201 (+) Transcript_972:1447-2049(+)
MKCFATAKRPLSCTARMYARAISAPRIGSSPLTYSPLRPPFATRWRLRLGPRITFAPLPVNSLARAEPHWYIRSTSKVAPIARRLGQLVTCPTWRASMVRNPCAASCMFSGGMLSRGIGGVFPTKYPAIKSNSCHPRPFIMSIFSSKVISLTSFSACDSGDSACTSTGDSHSAARNARTRILVAQSFLILAKLWKLRELR